MSHEKNQDKHNFDEWEPKAQQLINAKFDLEKQLSWEQSLAERGIYRKPSTAKRISLRRGLAVAASLLFLLAAGWFMMIQSNTPAQKMALKYMESPHQLVDEVQRGAEGIAQNKGRAMEAYYNRQYEVALKHLQTIEAQGQADADVYFQMGLCLMYQKMPNYTVALQSFAEAQSLDAESYQDEINWYSALCYVLTDQTDAAKTALQKVADSPSSRKHKDAEQLLQTLATRQ
ncbi:MAG: hypothetical protein KDC44_01155 [Phaeodactylibacter sp.]|nr:hypothetical protein [Phaeodactylibacter sp.]